MSLATLTHRVADRWVTAARILLADDRFRPPKTIVNGVDNGDLNPKVLQIWGLVVDKMGEPGVPLNYAGAVKYFKNKCAKMGVPLPAKYMNAGQGASHGPFKIMNGDQIEDWVKERLKSAGLADEVQQTIKENKQQAQAVQGSIDDLLKNLEKSLDAKQKQELNQAQKEVQQAQKAMDEMEKAVAKHENVDAPVISFEQQFQTLLHQAMNDLSRKQVLAQAKAVLAKFEAEMQAGAKQASVGDWWDKIVKYFDMAVDAIKGWADDLFHSADRINDLFDSVS